MTQPDSAEQIREMAEQGKKNDLRVARSSDLWPAAVDFVADQMNADEKEKMRSRILKDPRGWWVKHHFSSGRSLRNSLRAAYYGEGEFGITNLDNVWVELVVESVDLHRTEVSG